MWAWQMYEMPVGSRLCHVCRSDLKTTMLMTCVPLAVLASRAACSVVLPRSTVIRSTRTS